MHRQPDLRCIRSAGEPDSSTVVTPGLLQKMSKKCNSLGKFPGLVVLKTIIKLQPVVLKSLVVLAQQYYLVVLAQQYYSTQNLESFMGLAKIRAEISGRIRMKSSVVSRINREFRRFFRKVVLLGVKEFHGIQNDNKLYKKALAAIRYRKCVQLKNGVKVIF